MIEAAKIWNEPNNKSHWDILIDPEWERFAAMAIAAAKAIHSVRPHLPRVLGGISPIDPRFIDNMKARGVQVVFDAIDTSGNGRLCAAVDQVGLGLIAKVTTVQSWDQTVASTYAAAPRCRNVLYATSSDRNYADTQYPAVAAFRAAMAKYFPDRAPQLSMWELEGWISAQWLTDAVASCGSSVTRACVEQFMNRPQPYDAHGLLIPADFVVAKPGPTERGCINVARWHDSPTGGKGGGWITQVPDMNTNCFTGPAISYTP